MFVDVSVVCLIHAGCLWMFQLCVQYTLGVCGCFSCVSNTRWVFVDVSVVCLIHAVCLWMFQLCV